MDYKEFWSRFKDITSGPRTSGALLSTDKLAGEIGGEKLAFYANKSNVSPEVFDNINNVLGGFRPVQQSVRNKSLDIVEDLEYLKSKGKTADSAWKRKLGTSVEGITPSKLTLSGGGKNPFLEFTERWKIATSTAPSSGTPSDVHKLIPEFYGDPILSPNNEKLTATDRIIFIAMTFVIRAVSLYIVEWAVNTYMVKSFQDAFKLYLVCYLSLFTLWVIMVNSSKTLFFKLLFYYVSTDPHGMGRIIIHLFVQLMILPVPLIVKSKGFEYTEEEYTYEKRRNTMSILSNFTFFIWAITSIIATQY